MVLVFFVVNLLRIDLYDVVKEIKKGRDTMKTIIKRSILDYLKNPVLWIGLIIIVASMYQCLSISAKVLKRENVTRLMRLGFLIRTVFAS